MSATLPLFDETPAWEVRAGDSVDVLKSLAPCSFDALVTDPPAGIGFMGAEWDSDKGGRDAWVAWLAGVMREALRVLKPGAHGLVWALPRTSHWTATALEDAGFEVRDVVTHLFGTGFPKHKAALKPGSEHWILVRKPVEGSIRANAEKYGAGLLEVDACRLVVTPDDAEAMKRCNTPRSGRFAVGPRRGAFDRSSPSPPLDASLGRWPANVTLDEEAAAMLDAQSGKLRPGERPARGSPNRAKATIDFGLRNAHLTGTREVLDGGGASRFFYVAKPSKAERGEGNTHPTVKSIALMRWLCRLVTPKGGVVLDPFAGSGTTGLACRAEGLRFLGIEREAKWASLARKRMERAP